MTTATPMPAHVRQTLIAVLQQLDNGEASDLLGDAFDVDQAGYADAVRDLTWCRNELAELLGVPPGTAISADHDNPPVQPARATPISTTCEQCGDAVATWMVREQGDLTAVCDDCYMANYAQSASASVWEADPIPPAPSDTHAELAALRDEVARLQEDNAALRREIEANVIEAVATHDLQQHAERMATVIQDYFNRRGKGTST